ncbi:uncharacterized protein [Physcomitrium patens]|uniref:Uncharacterized protein n=1 Tax=Physcomitrium patens TaxID=3218 RepID=A0A2K1KT53_PHYPA|nr:uncharacterized protein LOC112279346 isoform X2 [Physcomitrium patens]PNR56940.1 hypothetical protein PHYPA_003933 [Physcomitrium patens]|eukprot:XP_024369475.1 uncharacterized protein LOC112279346 isoform X2 [Physcomitrella patens]
MAEKAGMKGPVARTLLLVLHSGSAGGVTLQPECVEGLLSYVRLFFAQPRSGKLSTLAAAGRKVHTVTSWDPGQQSVEAIVQGLADWKAVEGDVGFNIKHTLMEVAQFLYKTTGSSVADMNSANKPNPMYGWEASAMLRSRLLVILPQDSAGGGIHTYHKYMEEALAGVGLAEIEFETTFLDISVSNSAVKPIMTTAAASVPVRLSTIHYKLLPSHASNLFIDLAYFHLELSAIAVKGMLPYLLETSGENAENLALKEREIEDEHIAAQDTVFRLVICQNNFSPVKALNEVSVYPGSPFFRESRTISLNCMKTTLSTNHLLALPCASIVPTLPEVFQRGPAARLWENLKHHDNDSFIIALSLEEDEGNITHFFTWRDGRFWLHTITRSEQKTSGSAIVADYKGRDEILGDREAGAQQKNIPQSTPEVVVTTPPRRVGHLEKPFHSIKKRNLEEADDSVPLNSPIQATWRHKRSAPHASKQMERPSRWFPGPTADSIVGSAERYFLQLALLISPIRIAFVTEDPPVECINNASKCIAKLLEHTESNDISLFPLTVDTPSARRDLYTNVWRELDGMVKQAVDKTRGQEELAHAIAIAAADLSVFKERAPVIATHPVPPEKPTEFAPVNKRRRCEEVPRDTLGRPVFPIKLGPSLQVYDLGKIVWNRPNFHSEKYIWPAGYKSRRAYASMLNSENRIFYWCEIVDDGQAPEFRLTPEDDQNNPVVGISATAVWTVVVKRVGALRIEEGGKKTFANVSGPEYFGYANPTIARLIQQLPDAEKCTKYKRQDYLPNVPMRLPETETAQGAVIPEGSDSPRSRDLAFHKTPPHSHPAEEVIHTPNPILLPSPVRENSGGAQSFHDDAPPPVAEEPLHSPVEASCKEDVKPLSWLTEFRITERSKVAGKLPKQFAGCSPGSLFNHYWSAKLRRSRIVELDGRQ